MVMAPRVPLGLRAPAWEWEWHGRASARHTLAAITSGLSQPYAHDLVENDGVVTDFD